MSFGQLKKRQNWQDCEIQRQNCLLNNVEKSFGQLKKNALIISKT
jgi:hypothetical protein